MTKRRLSSVSFVVQLFKEFSATSSVRSLVSGLSIQGLLQLSNLHLKQLENNACSLPPCGALAHRVRELVKRFQPPWYYVYLEVVQQFHLTMEACRRQPNLSVVPHHVILTSCLLRWLMALGLGHLNCLHSPEHTRAVG